MCYGIRGSLERVNNSFLNSVNLEYCSNVKTGDVAWTRTGCTSLLSGDMIGFHFLFERAALRPVDLVLKEATKLHPFGTQNCQED